jgi:hypothetical protein
MLCVRRIQEGFEPVSSPFETRQGRSENSTGSARIDRL